MTLLSDRQIAERAVAGMVEPFHAEQVRVDGVSYGCSSYGYDVRLGNEFAVYPFVGVDAPPLDPGSVSEHDIKRVVADEFVLQPGGFVLAVTAEYLTLPENVTGLVCDKSSWARLGLSLQNTVLEAGWHGQVTLEIHNQNTARSIRLRAGQGIAQVLFADGASCLTSYADRNGRYQGQRGITVPRR